MKTFGKMFLLIVVLNRSWLGLFHPVAGSSTAAAFPWRLEGLSNEGTRLSRIIGVFAGRSTANEPSSNDRTARLVA
jgi:hypothetical protein